MRKKEPLPIIETDSTLVKSTAENNRKETSKIGTQLVFRSPKQQVVEPLPLPHFTATPRPKHDEWAKVDLTTSLADLLRPKKVMETAEEIKAWIKRKVHKTQRPMQYLGNEANTQDPSEFEKADLRVLICRLSAYDAVGGSMTHGALAQIMHEAAKERGINLYVDFAFMPSNNEDCGFLEEEGVPYAFGRTSKRPPKDFDLMIVSFALTMEVWNITGYLINSGIEPFRTERLMDQKIRDAEYPLILAGGVVADALDYIHGKVEGREGLVDAMVLGDGEITLPYVIERVDAAIKSGMTKEQFLRDMHNHDYQWYYEPNCYEHKWETDPETGYPELVAIERKPECDYALPVGVPKRVYMDDLNKHAVFTAIPTHWDGCILEGSLVLTDKGIQKVESLVNTGPGLIETHDGPKKYQGVVFQGTRQTIKLKTRSGRVVQVTENHQFLIQSKTGRPVWKRADEVQVKDRIMGAARADLLPENKGLAPEIWQIMGLIYGDGSLYQKDNGEIVAEICIPDHELETLTYLRNVQSTLGFTAWEKTVTKEAIQKNEKLINVTQGKIVFSIPLKDFPELASIMPVFQHRSAWKNGIPEILWQSGKAQIRAFLRGLGTTDGHVSYGQWSCGTVWENLASDIQRLWTFLGVYCTKTEPSTRERNNLTEDPKDMFYILTSGTKAKTLSDQVGFEMTSKMAALTADNRSTHVSQVKTDMVKSDRFLGIPNATDLMKRLLPIKMGIGKIELGDKLYSLVNKIRTGNRDFIPDNQISTVIQAAKIYGRSESDLSFLENYQSKGWFFDEIISVEDGGIQRVYDPCSVEDNQSYLCDGLINHNTLGNSVDIQISSGCLCVAEGTIIETEMGFEKIEDAFERLGGEKVVDNVSPDFVITTRKSQHSAKGIIYGGKKKVRKYTFVQQDDEDRGGEEWKIEIVATEDHRVGNWVWDESEPEWVRLKDLSIGQEVWGVDKKLYDEALACDGKMNTSGQFYYANCLNYALTEIGDEFEADCYDVVEVDEYNEYIANGLVTHNSGGLCSFCFAEGTEIFTQDYVKTPIENLTDEMELETPYGQQRPEGVMCNGEEQCLKITTTRGKWTLTATPDHKIMAYVNNKIALVPMSELKVGDPVVMANVTLSLGTKETREHREFLFPEAKRGQSLPEGVLPFDERPLEEQLVMKALRKAGGFLDTVASIEDVGLKTVYDIWDIPEGHLLYANHFVVSNCFTPNTCVVMANGSILPISEVKLGDEIITAKGRRSAVTQIFQREVAEAIIDLHIQGFTSKISGTLNHRLVVWKGREDQLPSGWEGSEELTLSDIEEGDYVLGEGTTPETPVWRKVTQKKFHMYQGKVFNLEVEDEEHTYQVTEEDPTVTQLLREIEGLTDAEKEELLKVC